MKNKYYLYIELPTLKTEKKLNAFFLFSENDHKCYYGTKRIGDESFKYKDASVYFKTAIEITRKQFDEYLEYNYCDITVKIVKQKWPEFLI